MFGQTCFTIWKFKTIEGGNHLDPHVLEIQASTRNALLETPY